MVSHPDYQALFQALPDIHLALSPELTIVAASAAAAAGRRPDELLGQPALQALAGQPALLAVLLDAVALVRQSRAAHEVEAAGWRHRTWPVLGTDEQVRYFLHRAEPVPTPAGPATTGHYQQLLDDLPLVVWTAQADGTVDYQSQRWLAYTGYAPDQAGSNDWLSAVHPDDQARAEQTWQAALAAGHAYEIEYRLRRHDGQYRWQLVRAAPRHDAAGQLVSWTGSAMDIQEQKAVALRLANQERHLQQILRQVPAHIATLLGPDHVYGFLNEKGNQLFGGSVQVGIPAAQAVPSLVTNGYIKLIDEIYRTGEPFVLTEMPMVQPTADGPEVTLYFDGVFQPLTDEQGATQGILVFGIDVTERVLAKQRAAELMAEIREQNAQFRSMVESLPLFVYITDEEGNMLYINPQRYEFTGQDPAVALPDWIEPVHPDDRGRIQAEFAQGRAQQRAWAGEFRLRRHDGQYRWQLLRAVPMRRPDGSVARWYGSSVDIDDQKQFQQRLEAKDVELHRILNSLPAIVNTMQGPEHRFAFLSDQFVQLLGERAKLGERVADVQPEIAEQGFVRVLDEVYRTGEPFKAVEQRVEVRNFRSGELETHYYNFTYQLLPPLEGNPDTRGILSFAVDVTEQVQTRRRAEELTAQVGRSNERLRRMTEALPVMTFINDAQGRTEYTSPQWYEYAGYPADTDVNEVWLSLVHPDDRQRATAEYSAAWAEKRGWTLELRLRRHDGQYRWHLSRTVPAETVDGPKWYGSTVDIHEQQRLSQELAASTAHFSQLLEALPQLTWTASPDDGRVLYTNQSFRAYTGATEAELLGLSWTRFIHPADEQATFKSLHEKIRRGERTQTEHRLRGADGRYRWFLANLLPLRNAAGDITQWLGTNTDIDDQKRVQEQLRRQDQRLSQILGQAPAIIATMEGPDHRYAFFNESHKALMAHRAVLGQPVAAVLPEMVEQGFVALFDTVYQTGETFVGHEVLIRPPGRSGSSASVYLDLSFQALRDEQGQVYGVLAFAVEATERVQARQSAAALAAEVSRRDIRLRRMTEALPAVSFIYSPTGTMEYLSPQWYHYTGKTTEPRTTDVFTAFVHPDDQAGVAESLHAALATGQPWELEYRLRRHDGQYRWQISRGVPEHDAQGRALRWYGTLVDNHAQKELQHELRRSEEKFRFMADATPVIIWTATAHGDIDYCNRRFFDFTATQPDDMRAGGWVTVVHPADAAASQAAWRRSVATGEKYEVQHRLRGTNGRYRWQLVRALPLRDAEGQIQKWYGSSMDVQEQREMQEQLQRSEEQFRFMAESIPQIVWTARPNGQLDYLNQRWTELTGLSVEHGLQFGWTDLIPPEDRASVTGKFVEGIGSGTNYEQESRLLSAQEQRYRWFLHRGTPMRDAEGRVLKWFGTSTDIDDFKQVQQQLEAQNGQLARINADLDSFVYTASHDLKQPINNMAGIFEELTRTAYFRDPDAIKLVTMFERALQQIHQTIHDLSDVVQLQRRHTLVPAEQVALALLTQEVLGSIQEQSTSLGAAFELDFATVPVVRFIRPNLQSILYNLLSNALKYAEPGRPPRVQLRSSLVDGTPVLTITDNGQGIDLERHGKELFQLFRRFHEHVEGSGMGLYLVNRMVQLNGAWLEVDSQVGVGSTFRIYFKA